MIIESTNDTEITTNADISFTIQCRIDSIPVISSVTWYKNGVIVNEIPGRIDASADGNLFELELNGVFENDTGLYVCSFNNPAIPLVVSEAINLTVVAEGSYISYYNNNNYNNICLIFFMTLINAS